MASAVVPSYTPQPFDPALADALAACHLDPPAPAATGVDVPALQLWKAGHRLFFTLIQATVVALRDATSPPSHPAPAETRTAATLLAACAAAMRLTTTFSPHDYQHTVRPSMAPPQHALAGFSGMWSADHCALVVALSIFNWATDRVTWRWLRNGQSPTGVERVV
ncbi:hypothetical protein OV450_8238 [Actinobacteria bacterium OV450]|nr:hypothetical protein OV450_8238 [Actinobacteria bacterium OV450]